MLLALYKLAHEREFEGSATQVLFLSSWRRLRVTVTASLAEKMKSRATLPGVFFFFYHEFTKKLSDRL